jgi:copper chaperone CopZ
MKTSWLTIILIAGVAAGCATTEISPGTPRHVAADLASARDVVLTVHGLSCPLCANNLDGQLRRIDGVDEATIDLKTGAVSVRLGEDHSVSAGDLARAVEDAGFTLKAIEPVKAGE